MHLELMTKLLDTERQYFTKSRRSGIIQELEKCFDTSSRSKNDAIDDAHQKRDLKKAVEQGDFETIRHIIDGETPHNTPIQQPNWGMLKFPDLEEK
jgi:DNA sulfur modification protein DndC